MNKVVVELTQEQIAELDASYDLLSKKKISEEEYVATCRKYGYEPIDKRINAIYEPGDNFSRIGYKYCCYNHPKGKYFQDVLKIIIRSTVSNVHSLLVGKDKEGKSKTELKDDRLMFLDNLVKCFVREHIGNDGYQYKKDFSNNGMDILLWYADNNTGFRTKLLTLINIFSDKKTLFHMNGAEEFNSKKFG